MQAGVGDADLDRHFFQKWRIGQSDTYRAEISADVELEPVTSRDKRITGQQRFAHPSIRIRHNGFQAPPVRTLKSEEIDLHSDGGLTARRVENVG